MGVCAAAATISAPIMPHESDGTVYPIVTELAPAAVDCAPLPPAEAQFTCLSQRRVLPEVMLPSQPVTSASTTMSPDVLVTVTVGDAPTPKLVAIFRTGVV